MTKVCLHVKVEIIGVYIKNRKFINLKNAVDCWVTRYLGFLYGWKLYVCLQEGVPELLAIAASVHSVSFNSSEVP